ncbi:MAG: putative alpha/beta superfamily hydrolase [Flavobacteriales bacterium]|jgi:predicted alpha/beta superfamily hydrolase
MTSIPIAKLETLHSTIVGEDYKLQISLPFPFDPENNKYPVLIYLDAFMTSEGMNELAKSNMLFNNFEQFVRVGISYNINPTIRGQGSELRERDLIPPINKMDTNHGGDKFLSFIKTELIPYMATNYGTDPNDRGLLGHSYGGLFTTWAFKEEPELFNRLAILSPSLWYGGDDFILESPDFLKNAKKVQNLKVFISYGSLESAHFRESNTKLYDALKTNNNIQVLKVIFEDEDHGTVWNAATTRALFTLYEDPFKVLIKKAKKFNDSKDYKQALESYELAFKKHSKQTDKGDKYNIACIYALTGDTDNAFKFLQMLIDSKKKTDMNTH